MKNSLIKCSAPLPPDSAMSKEQLKSAASSGDADTILSHLDSGSADKIRTAMKDKKTADAVIKAFKNKNGGV